MDIQKLINKLKALKTDGDSISAEIEVVAININGDYINAFWRWKDGSDDINEFTC